MEPVNQAAKIRKCWHGNQGLPHWRLKRLRRGGVEDSTPPLLLSSTPQLLLHHQFLAAHLIAVLHPYDVQARRQTGQIKGDAVVAFDNGLVLL